MESVYNIDSIGVLIYIVKMDCQNTDRQWNIVLLYIGAIGYLQKRILNLYRKKRAQKKRKKFFFGKIRHVPGCKSVQKIGDRLSISL